MLAHWPLPITPNKENQAKIFFDEEQWWDDSDGRYYQIYDNNEDYDDPDSYDRWWYGYEDDGDGEGVYEYDDGQDPEWQGYGDDGDVAWSSELPATDHDGGTANAGDDIKEEYYKGKGKRSNDGCFNCGSKWHMARWPRALARQAVERREPGELYGGQGSTVVEKEKASPSNVERALGRAWKERKRAWKEPLVRWTDCP